MSDVCRIVKVSVGWGCPISAIGRLPIQMGATLGPDIGESIGMVSELSSQLTRSWGTDPRVFSPEALYSTSGPASEVLIPRAMRPGKYGLAALPQHPSA